MLLNFFDEVYVINLPHRVDRLEQMDEELHQHGIPFTIWEAIRNDNGVIGLVETMKKLLYNVVEKRQSNVIILEDDASFLVSDPVSFIKEIMPQIPKRYHLFYLGLNLITRPTRISQNVLKVNDCYSTHAIVYSYEGAKLALDMLNSQPAKAYDIMVRENILPLQQCYCTYPMIATQRVSYSDIEKKDDPKWGQLMTMTYAMHTKNLPMATEIARCIGTHKIDEKTPWIDETKFEVQHPELLGKECDCGRFIYTEDKCPTCTGDKWRIIWVEKQ